MHRTKEQLGLMLIPGPHSERRSGVSRMCHRRVAGTLVASFLLALPTTAGAKFACKPEFTFKDVRFSKAQNQQREWTATLTVDALRCTEYWSVPD
jgi:hypothetical protein